jgi:hypothetical protein
MSSSQKHGTAQHTPGPWQPFEILDGIAIKDNRNVTIAICDYATDADAIEVSEWETEANAHLIAAAPELFAALEDFFNIMHDYQSSVRKGYVKHAMDMARAAIAKAKGGGA